VLSVLPCRALQGTELTGHIVREAVDLPSLGIRCVYDLDAFAWDSFSAMVGSLQFGTHFVYHADLVAPLSALR
jgi:hypothetical protein